MKTIQLRTEKAQATTFLMAQERSSFWAVTAQPECRTSFDTEEVEVRLINTRGSPSMAELEKVVPSWSDVRQNYELARHLKACLKDNFKCEISDDQIDVTTFYYPEIFLITVLM